MARAVADIETLLAAMERHGIERIELEDAQGCLSMALPPDTTPAAIPIAGTRPSGAPVEDRGSLAKATIAGRFLQVHPWRTKPFAEIGQRVAAGEIVGLIQVGCLYVPVVALADGVVDAILAEPEALVGYGSPLFRLSA